MYRTVKDFGLTRTDKFYKVGREFADGELTADEIKGALGLGVIEKIKIVPTPKPKAKPVAKPKAKK